MPLKVHVHLNCYFSDVDHVSETDLEGNADEPKNIKTESKLVAQRSTDDSDTDVMVRNDGQNEGGINFYAGKTSRWHRPKRIKGTDEDAFKYCLIIRVHVFI